MTVVRARWFPATVLLPDKQVWRKVFVILAEGGEGSGLHIWRQPDGEPAYRAQVDYAATTIPSARAARAGVDVVTDLGLVVVTPGGSCRCGALGRWAGPDWAHTVAVG